MRTLIFASHQDDESLSCGGLIQVRRAAGHNVRVITLHKRLYNYGEGEQFEKSQLQDYINAMKLLDVSSYKFYGWDEGEPQTMGYYRTLKVLETELARYGPDEVVVPAASDLNQDHRWLAECLKIALRPANLGEVTRILAALGIDGRLSNSINWLIPLTVEQMHTKLQAMACYGKEFRNEPHPRGPETLMAYHRLAGSQCGSVFAEPYVLLFQKEA